MNKDSRRFHPILNINYIQMKKMFLYFVIGFCCFPVMAQDKGIIPPAHKNKFHLYLLIGQSNMAGRGIVEAQDTLQNCRILSLDKYGNWDAAKEPLHFDTPIAGVGPGFAFAKKIIEIADDTVVIGLIPCAAGGSGIDAWSPGVFWEQTLSFPYDNAIIRTKLAMKDGTLKGILWHQGESDCSPEKAKDYSNKLEHLIIGLRQEFDMPFLPFIAGEIQSKNNGDLINQALHKVKNKVPFYEVVFGSGFSFMADSVHLDSRSEREFGRRYAEKMIEVQQISINNVEEKR